LHGLTCSGSSGPSSEDQEQKELTIAKDLIIISYAAITITFIKIVDAQMLSLKRLLASVVSSG
jgi:hypothetical protein